VKCIWHVVGADAVLYNYFYNEQCHEIISGYFLFPYFHRDIHVSIGWQHGDLDVNWETVSPLLFARFARFISLKNLDVICCYRHFMHTCHARHCSTLKICALSESSSRRSDIDHFHVSRVHLQSVQRMQMWSVHYQKQSIFRFPRLRLRSSLSLVDASREERR